MTLGCFASQTSQLGGLVTNGWCDATPMEPLSTLHHLIEIEVAGISLSNRAVCTVVDNFRGTHRCACLGIIKTNAVATTSHKLCIHAIATQGVDGNLPNLMLGQLTHEVGLVTIVGHRDGHVSLTTAGDDAEALTLDKTVVALRRQAEHNLT